MNVPGASGVLSGAWSSQALTTFEGDRPFSAIVEHTA